MGAGIWRASTCCMMFSCRATMDRTFCSEPKMTLTKGWRHLEIGVPSLARIDQVCIQNEYSVPVGYAVT